MSFEIMGSIRRRLAEWCRRHPGEPTVVRLDAAAYRKLGKELNEYFMGDCYPAPTRVYGLTIVVVDAPEWLEVA